MVDQHKNRTDNRIIKSLTGILAFLPLFYTPIIHAQNDKSNCDLGFWTNISITTKPLAGKWNVSYSLEYRRKDNLRAIDLWAGMVNIDYIANSHWRVGAGYEFFLNSTQEGYLPEYRYYPEVLGSYVFQRWKASLRSRLMNTYTNWKQPHIEHRNRLKLSYLIKNAPVHPFIYAEPYNQINSQFYQLNKIRYSIGFTYEPANYKHSQFEIYYMIEKYHLRPFVRHVLEIDYSYSF
ncbi:MAG: DUF2490 domain-containing protein [Tannerella sp.]|jgi:hypothetical protein|nr:DUF2490 domain-containing protein [Tannerella sp.]